MEKKKKIVFISIILILFILLILLYYFFSKEKDNRIEIIWDNFDAKYYIANDFGWLKNQDSKVQEKYNDNNELIELTGYDENGTYLNSKYKYIYDNNNKIKEIQINNTPFIKVKYNPDETVSEFFYLLKFGESVCESTCTIEYFDGGYKVNEHRFSHAIGTMAENINAVSSFTMNMYNILYPTSAESDAPPTYVYEYETANSKYYKVVNQDDFGNTSSIYYHANKIDFENPWEFLSLLPNELYLPHVECGSKKPAHLVYCNYALAIPYVFNSYNSFYQINSYDNLDTAKTKITYDEYGRRTSTITYNNNIIGDESYQMYGKIVNGVSGSKTIFKNYIDNEERYFLRKSNYYYDDDNNIEKVEVQSSDDEITRDQYLTEKEQIINYNLQFDQTDYDEIIRKLDEVEMNSITNN